MKILYLADATIPSSAANAIQVLQMAAAMARLGHDVEVVSPRDRARLAKAPPLATFLRSLAIEESISVDHLPFLRVGRRLAGSYVWMAVGYALLRRPDLVYTRNVRIASLAARMGLSTIQESHGPISTMRMRRAALALATSPALRRWVFISARLRTLHDDLPISAKRLAIEHDAVDWPRFSEVSAPREARRVLGWDLDRFTVVHSGHVYAGRGGELLIEVAKRMPAVLFVMVGGNPADAGRLRQTAAAQRAENILWIPHQPLSSLPCYLFAADVLVMPYSANAVISDGQTRTIDFASPMKMFEYMAAARPIVASAFPGIQEVLRHDENALLVRPDSVDAFVEALLRLIASKDLASKLGNAARDEVKHHTWARRAERILARA